tara:strand:- start:4691 stop:4897 length:207 start_codon:yes stop_codon:yes gene_type:complete
LLRKSWIFFLIKLQLYSILDDFPFGGLRREQISSADLFHPPKRMIVEKNEINKISGKAKCKIFIRRIE